MKLATSETLNTNSVFRRTVKEIFVIKEEKRIKVVRVDIFMQFFCLKHASAWEFLDPLFWISTNTFPRDTLVSSDHSISIGDSTVLTAWNRTAQSLKCSQRILYSDFMAFQTLHLKRDFDRPADLKNYMT